ncbi:hypothetical protein [Streptomyces sp. NPDC050804]|nr:hypothetical protein OG214_18905 [Streptomyces sp. NBC_00872]
MEWIDPRYAELVAAMKRAEAEQSDADDEPRPLRGFIVPPKD